MDENNNRNFIVAILLSGLVLLLWQVFYAAPKMEQDRLKREAAKQHELALGKKPVTPGVEGAKPAASQPSVSAPVPSGSGQSGTQPSLPVPGAPAASSPAVPGGLPSKGRSRLSVLKENPRYPINTPTLSGSISLKGGRIDDLVLRKYRVDAKKDSAEVVFYSPSGSQHPLYAEYGWSIVPGAKVKLPDANTLWTAQGSGSLTPTSPVTLVYDNGEGVVFKRTISLDDKYMFRVDQSIENKTSSALTLYPYALISRHEIPKTEGFYILHEGLIGVLGEDGLQEVGYDDILEDKSMTFRGKQGWLGITDKYWASAIIPGQSHAYEAHFSGQQTGASTRFQADYLLGAVTVPAGGSGQVSGQLFAGAKQANLIDNYADQYKIKQFDLMIDWGWFYFITKPMFHGLHFLYGMVGNFGIAILLLTVVIKLLFYPLASKSYESMSKMKKLQPDMQRIRERFKDDKVRQQQETMALYQKSGANPLSGCLPIIVQIPVFFALYKVLFVSIDMRHAPFFGWIQDLSAPDPTSIINLFGLLPFAVSDSVIPAFLQPGVWPIIMGVTMWIQMKLNPQQADPTQQMIFNWMPVMFTFMLGTFASGLVIYWAWNNFLSVAQQRWIMKKNDVEVDLLENTGLKKLFSRITGKSGKT